MATVMMLNMTKNVYIRSLTSVVRTIRAESVVTITVCCRGWRRLVPFIRCSLVMIFVRGACVYVVWTLLTGVLSWSAVTRLWAWLRAIRLLKTSSTLSSFYKIGLVRSFVIRYTLAPTNSMTTMTSSSGRVPAVMAQRLLVDWIARWIVYFITVSSVNCAMKQTMLSKRIRSSSDVINAR